MTITVPPEASRVTNCPACGYPTLDASVCALCSQPAFTLAPG